MTKSFQNRHIGPNSNETAEMLQQIGVSSLDDLIDTTIPTRIRLSKDLNISTALSETELLDHLQERASQNKVFKSFIGQGYFNTITPPVILRNIFENPGWYTQYTPYQAEISQGRLEALFHFQTLITELTGMDIANASLLDEATAAAEAMMLLYRIRKPEKTNAHQFIVSPTCYPQTIAVLQNRAEPLGIRLVIQDPKTVSSLEACFGALIQYPDSEGNIAIDSDWIKTAQNADVPLAVATDLLSLCLLTPPGEWGAEVVIGSTQRFGVPLGYGGPHAAFIAVKNEHIRQVPGRIIGLSKDRLGNAAYRMTLQTREQHIRREKATSNICTAQALLAIMATMYAVYHGPDGLKSIAESVHTKTKKLATLLQAQGILPVHSQFFDTLRIPVTTTQQTHIKEAALKQQINLFYPDDTHIQISCDETSTDSDIQTIATLITSNITGNKNAEITIPTPSSSFFQINDTFQRKTSFLSQPVFHQYQTETTLMRYLKQLENKDLSLTHSMIALGSCTMKLNAAAEMMPLSWKGFSNLHPFIPIDQAAGYQAIITELEKDLATITGFSAVSLQPNSGAQGEYAGLRVIQAFHTANKQHQRKIVLIPSSAHGTNPASAALAGLDVVIVKCDECGNIDLEDLSKKATAHKDTLSSLMITYPSTHGVYEENIQEVCQIIHENGGQVYMDGANMNAQVGLTNPATIGADVCHLNLHKTFAIPHGGGGPGMGPIAVAKHLAEFLPTHPLIQTGGKQGIPAVSATPWGSSSILLISYAYIKMMGKNGLTHATKIAILNANTIKEKLKGHYPILFTGPHGRVAHELIIDCRGFKKTAKIEVEDVAKRLIDYGFHAPTMSFPVPGTLMIEPTESENKAELDRFCDALIQIRQEIAAIESQQADASDNVLKNAPHTAEELTADQWSHPYTRQEAAYPLPHIRANKFWPTVARVDNAYGDRNPICSCPPVSLEDNDTDETEKKNDMITNHPKERVAS